MNEADSLARRRFLMLSLLRASGAVVMLFGALVMGTGLIEPRDLIGGLIFVAGVTGGLLTPALLARRWRSPRP